MTAIGKQHNTRSVRIQESHLAGSGCRECTVGGACLRSCDDVRSEKTKLELVNASIEILTGML